jgi:hypothetical protein
MNTHSPIQQLIESHCSKQNISYKELITRTGYSNVSVGLKRLKQLFDADFQSARGLIQKLPKVLNIDISIIEQAIADTLAQLRLDADQHYRMNFKPNFIIRTANRGRPKQVFIAGILNASEYITSEFPEHLSVDQYIGYAVEFFDKNKRQLLGFYYAPEDIVINYSPDSADVFSLTGNKVKHLEHSVLNGRLSIQFR